MHIPVKHIELPADRRVFAVSDVHGCRMTGLVPKRIQDDLLLNCVSCVAHCVNSLLRFDLNKEYIPLAILSTPFFKFLEKIFAS